ncbi:MAG TPA: ABC transporter permease [Microvirga sp.]|jgi:peptide/nickel transport system permease protein|nr:ABC transporter permease [Microvirga sp.]
MRSLRLIAQRLLAALPTLLLVSLGAFLLLESAPGDAADAYLAQTGGDAGFAAELRQRLGLEGTPLDRLAAFYAGLLQGDLGTSALFNRPVLHVIAERLPTTLLLMAAAVSFTALVGSALGLLAGVRPGGWRDQAITVATLGLLAMPNFWLALLLVLLFGVQLAWLPTSGLQSLGAPKTGLAAALDMAWHLVLPTLALGAGYLALYTRTLRAGMAATWRADHVRAARARGLAERRVVWRAVARPALLPVVVLLGQQVGTLFGGSVVTETVFGIPGLGRLTYEAVAGRDTLLLVGVVMAGTVVVILANLLVDLLLVRLDPRIGASGG